MENIAEALKMAFGVLIALLLISLLVYAFNIISSTENTRTDKEVVQEVIDFNKKFLAFEKSSMYGTDVISVISLAISTNETYNAEYSLVDDGKFYEERDGTINIIFKINKDVTAWKTYYDRTPKLMENPATGKMEYNRDWRLIEESALGHRNPEPTTILNGNRTYDLSNVSSFNLIKRIAIDGNSEVRTEIKGMKKTEIDESGFNDFKTRIFECTDVQTRPTGRVYSMTFIEKDV